MSSISSAVGAQSFSPLTQLQNELSSEVSSGAISSSDQGALSAALTDIDLELKSEMQSASGTQPPSPGDVQSKIDSLIANEVSNGKLTSAQADELKNVFAKAFKGGPHGAGGPPAGGPGGVGGDADGDGDGSSSNATSSTSTSSTSSSSGSTNSNASQVLQDFLKLLQNSQGSSASYSTGGNSLASQIQSLLVNYQT